MVLDLLLFGGAVALLTAGVVGWRRNADDWRLRRQQKQAWKMAVRAQLRGEPALSQHYADVARSIALQRLQLAEQQANLEEQRAQASGRTWAAQQARARADAIRQQLQAQRVDNIDPSRSPATAANVGLPVAMPVAPPVGQLQPYEQPNPAYAPIMQAQQRAARESAASPSPHYAAAAPGGPSAPPSVIYFQQPHQGSFYPAVSPQSYATTAVPTTPWMSGSNYPSGYYTASSSSPSSSFSSSHSQLGQPFLPPGRSQQ